MQRDTSDDAHTCTKPTTTLIMEKQKQKQTQKQTQQQQQQQHQPALTTTTTTTNNNGIRLLAGSSSSSSSSYTRLSRFNDKPVFGSPILAARDCGINTSEIFSTSSESCTAMSRDDDDGNGNGNGNDDIDATTAAATAAAFDTSNRNNNNPNNPCNDINDSVNINNFQRLQLSAEKRIEETKRMLDRRLNRIDSVFFRENPSQKVPRFAKNELSLGDQLGEGEFGSVYEIESLERQQPPCSGSDQSFGIILENPCPEGNQECSLKKNAHGVSRASAHGPAGASLTLPVAEDLIIDKGNLDGFIRRKIEVINEQEDDKITPTMYKNIQPTRKSNIRRDNNNNDIINNNINNNINNPNPFSNNKNNNNEHNGYTSNQQQAHHFHHAHHARHPPRRRAALKLKDRKGQMINRQNNVDSFDGYAVKLVRNDINNERKKRVAAVDMATEAKILSALDHPNIISIRGIMGYIERPGNYGIIMDKLRSTLQDQIKHWAKYTSDSAVPRAAPERRPILEHVPKWMLLGQQVKEEQSQLVKQTEFFIDRMEAVYDVAQAMRYLHKKRIIFRDLKPENVGLTKDNYVLFDFGLARELKDSDRINIDGDGEDDQYRATGLTGSRVFMAPEVAMCKNYGFSADVFSFAILFWEVMALKEVFPKMTMNKHFQLVIVKGRRPPSLNHILPDELNEMMKDSWAARPSQRPTFESICDTLFQEIDKRNSNTSSSSVMLPFGIGSSSRDTTENNNDDNNNNNGNGNGNGDNDRGFLPAEEFSKYDGYDYGDCDNDNNDNDNDDRRDGDNNKNSGSMVQRAKSLAKHLHLSQLGSKIEKVQETVNEKVLNKLSSTISTVSTRTITSPTPTTTHATTAAST